MHSFRSFVQNLSESYRNELADLLDYMRKEPLNMWNYMEDLTTWVLEDDGRMEVAAKLLGKTPNDLSEYEHGEDNWIDDLYNKQAQVPDAWEPEFAAWWKKNCLDDWMRNDPAETPSWAHMMLNGHKSLLPRTTWLVHFTNDPDGVARKGFKFGMQDVEKLGLTTYFKNTGIDKGHGGYNFAFSANSSESDNAADRKKYGDDAVMFQSAGVEVYHSADEEDQVIFWGPAVDPRDIIIIRRYDEGWIVEPKNMKHGRDKHEGGIFKAENFEDCVAWVEKNFQQYRKVLTGR